MALISFGDTCTITRTLKDAEGNVVYNDYDEPQIMSVYKGACHSQLSTSNTEISVNSGTVYLKADVEVIMGDEITLTTCRGRKIDAVASSVREMDVYGQHIVQVLIKQSLA